MVAQKQFENNLCNMQRPTRHLSFTRQQNLWKQYDKGTAHSNSLLLQAGIKKQNFSAVSEALQTVAPVVGAAFTTIVGGFAVLRYKVSKPDQYIVKTGLGVKDIDISKKTIQWPFQKCQFIEMNPRNYHFDLHAMRYIRNQAASLVFLMSVLM